MDSYFGLFGDKLAAWGANQVPARKIFLSMWHEPDDIDVNSGPGMAATDYAAAWRRFFTVLDQHGASPYVLRTWLITGYANNTHNWTDMYPGDAWVDWNTMDERVIQAAPSDTTDGRSSTRSRASHSGTGCIR